jgi:hypothetical protein
MIIRKEHHNGEVGEYDTEKKLGRWFFWDEPEDGQWFPVGVCEFCFWVDIEPPHLT